MAPRRSGHEQPVSIAAEAYYKGRVDSGLAMRAVDEILAQASVDPRMQPAAAMRALAATLARITERLG